MEKIALPKKRLFTSGSLGCTNAMVLYQRYVDFILSHGYEKTPHIGEADVVLVDTCASTEMQENASFDLMQAEQSRAKKDAKIIVCGCLPAINPEKFNRRWQGDFFTPSNQFMLARILGFDHEEEKFLTPYENPGRFMGAEDAKASTLHSHVPLVRLFARSLLELHRLNNWLPGNGLERLPWAQRLFIISQQCNAKNYTINISQGCIGECTFCVIPKAKGRTRSLPMGLIVEKIREKVQEGVRHLTLSSDDSGAYGIDIGTNLVELLKKIHEIPGEFHLYINCFDPRWWLRLGDGMKDMFALGKIRYLQCALQSGSPSVLRRMKRGYRIEDVLPHLRDTRSRFPNLVMASQFIAGFPGETGEDARASQTIIEEDLFDHIFVFDFSHRPGAEAAEIEGHLPQGLIKERGRQLRRAWFWSNARIQLGLRRKVKPSDNLMRTPLVPRRSQPQEIPLLSV
ncbi:MAG: radical SAM protein [Elusimicrobia bacterium]|nr:radical SAM protein [Elusimicrobiota bacterium]